MHELLRIINNERDAFAQIQELRKKVYGSHMDILVPKFIKPHYKGGYGADFIINPQECLDIAKYLKNERTITWVIDLMFHNSVDELVHKPNVSEKDFYTFEQYYFKGSLNDILKHICMKSKEESGFIRYEARDVIYDEDYHQYIYEGDTDEV